MSCLIDSGRSDFSCNTNAGGLKAIYVLASFDKDLKANSTIAAGTLTATTSDNDVYKFDLQDDANTFAEENEVSRANGTSIFNSTGTFQFKKQGALSQDLFQKLSKMRAQVIIEDYNGGFRLAGIENGVDFTVGTASGGAMADFAGYQVTFTGKELELAPYVDAALIGAGLAFDVQTGVVDPS